MNDAEYDKQKARIQRLINYWVKLLGLGWWRIDFAYKREGLKLDDNIDDTGTEFTAAKTHAHWQYLDALTEWNMPWVAGADDENLEKTVVHELVHLFINEMREWAGDGAPPGGLKHAIRHEERVVTQLTNALLRLRDHARAEGRKDAEAKRAITKRALSR